MATDGERRMNEILDEEKDPFVRQFLRFRFNGRSANAAAFEYAVGCVARNAATGAASMIKAMIVADRTPEEIAIELGTKTQNIITFAKMFFDVRRYLNNAVVLRRMVFAEPAKEMSESEAMRERRWLSAAFHRGWEGVEQVVFHRAPSRPADIEALSQKLQSSLASRALEFVMELEANGTPPSEADLTKFLAARNMQSRQPPPPPDETNAATVWLRALHGTIERKAEENPDDPTLEPIRQLKAARAQGMAQPTRRLRTRFGYS